MLKLSRCADRQRPLSESLLQDHPGSARRRPRSVIVFLWQLFMDTPARKLWTRTNGYVLCTRALANIRLSEISQFSDLHTWLECLTHEMGEFSEFCNIMHADGAGTKSSLAYMYWKETGDVSVWRGIAQVSNIYPSSCTQALPTAQS